MLFFLTPKLLLEVPDSNDLKLEQLIVAGIFIIDELLMGEDEGVIDCSHGV